MGKLFAASVVMQAGEILSSLIILQAVGGAVPLLPFIYAVTLMMFVSMVPVSVQGIGVREAVSLVALAPWLSPEGCFAVGVLVTLVHHVIPALAGGAVWLADSTARSFGAGAAGSV